MALQELSGFITSKIHALKEGVIAQREFGTLEIPESI